MSDERSFVSSMIEESLGLVPGTIDESLLSDGMVEEVSATLRGGHPEGFTVPALEQNMHSILAAARRAALAKDGFFVRKARWPKGRPFAVCLTHDVDNIRRPRGHLWRTRSRFGALDLLAGLVGLGNPYDNVIQIAAREKENGFVSSFYFLTANYPLKQVTKSAKAIQDAGMDVGMHGDFGTHDSLERMQEAVSRFSASFGHRPVGIREHYLKFDFSKSWKVMDEAGFDYDTTVGNNSTLGFKLGLASPFHPPDDSWKPMHLLEVPLVLMDTTLWGYLNRSEEEGFLDFMTMMEAVEEVNGLLTLLWHQEAVRMKGGRTYWRILRELRKHNCYVGSGAQLAHWWRERSVPLIKDGRLVRLEASPPGDLTLELDLAEGRHPMVRSGVMEARKDRFAVRPTGKDFQLEVS